MGNDEQRRRFGRILLAVLTLSLVAYGLFHLVLRRSGGDGMVGLKPIELSAAPLSVQEAAKNLAGARVGYAMAAEGKTYLIVSAGQGGALELHAAKHHKSPERVEVGLKTARTGKQLQVAMLTGQVADLKLIRFVLEKGVPFPSLQNRHQLPLVPLKDGQPMAMLKIAPVAGSTTVEVAGFAQLRSGRYSVQVFSTGKGRQLGLATNLYTASASPDWGSFQATVPVQLPAGETEAVVVVYDQDSAVKQVRTITFR